MLPDSSNGASANLSQYAGPQTTPDAAVTAVRDWLARSLPLAWREAAERGGPAAVRAVRTPAEYREWYPVYGRSGLVTPGWDLAYGGLGWAPQTVRAAEKVIGGYHLPRLNPLGLSLAAPALFAFGTEDQRRRFLPPITRAEEIWCQLFSEPGAGSDLASLSTRGERVQEDGEDGEAAGDWVITGQKVWTTWADRADFAVLLARTDPDVPKHQGITYFLLKMRQPGIDVRPLRHMGGEAEFFQVFIDGARVPDSQRVGDVGTGWRVAQATLSGERQMVSGAGSGGVDRVGGASTARLIRLARQRTADGLDGGWGDQVVRDHLIRLWCEEQVRGWTNQRVRARLASGLAPGPESSIGKVHASELNQRVQAAAADLLGASGVAWPADPACLADPAGPTGPADPADPADPGYAADPGGYAASMPAEVRGMLRSRANTIEGGTSEVNKNVLAERVLGLPKDPDPWRGKPWRDLPRA
jgi:alkylation response protein AidB-like acyl-CoA dehydrogenase